VEDGVVVVIVLLTAVGRTVEEVEGTPDDTVFVEETETTTLDSFGGVAVPVLVLELLETEVELVVASCLGDVVWFFSSLTLYSSPGYSMYSIV
jgi:hypothetical protein